MGLATARLAATRGFEVLIASRSQHKLEKAAGSIESVVTFYQVDLQDEQSVRDLLNKVAPVDHIEVTVSAPGSASGNLSLRWRRPDRPLSASG